MARKSHFFWWVPENGWGEGAANVGSDTVISLVDTEPGSGSTPQQDNFVVERIIGQWQVVSLTGLADQVVYHQRVYPTIASGAGVALRDLEVRDEADSDMLWHQVNMWGSNNGESSLGSWAGHSSQFHPVAPFMQGRYGHFDIKVARRVNEGESLIWHLQSTQGVPPGDGTVSLFLWCRVLLREG